MNNLDTRYQALLEDILHCGVEKKDRTGTGTLSVFGRQIRHNMSEGFPLLTTKKMAWKTIVTELLWFLRGETNIKFLLDYDCHIWDGDAFKNFMSTSHGDPDLIWNKEQFINLIKTDSDFAKKWGGLGPIYGKQWRDWNGRDEVKILNERDENGYLKFTTEHISGIDQITNLINELKTNPDSRRLMVNAWNVGELDKMVLPPCHYGFQVYTRKLSGEERWKLLENKVGEEIFKSMVDGVAPFGGGLSEELESNNIPVRTISLMWNQRSVDTFLGLPFNIASYGLLLEILGRIVNMVPEQLIANLGDTHLYQNHIEQAKEQISRTSYELPKLKLPKTDDFWNGFDTTLFGHLDPTDFTIEDYKSHPTIKAPLSN